MKNIALETLATAAIAVTTLMAPLPSQAQLRSQSGEIIVMEPHNLPEAAQANWSSIASSTRTPAPRSCSAAKA